MARGSFSVYAQPMRDEVTMQRRLSLAEYMHKTIPEGQVTLHTKSYVAAE